MVPEFLMGVSNPCTPEIFPKGNLFFFTRLLLNFPFSSFSFFLAGHGICRPYVKPLFFGDFRWFMVVIKSVFQVFTYLMSLQDIGKVRR
jgi:hypothetical protein